MLSILQVVRLFTLLHGNGDFDNTSGGAKSNVDYLVVAGGGGGAAANASAEGAAAGGAGGLRTSHPSCPNSLKGSQITIATGPHGSNTTVGAGGAGAMFGGGNDGAQGGPSGIAGHIASDGGGFGATIIQRISWCWFWWWFIKGGSSAGAGGPAPLGAYPGGSSRW